MAKLINALNQKWIYVCLIALFTGTDNVFAQDMHSVRSSSFEIHAKQQNNALLLTCVEGCAWEELRFTLTEDGKTQSVDQYGMVDTDMVVKNDDAALADFRIAFERRTEKIVCTGARGTSWLELSFRCKRKKCVSIIDENGVHVKNKAW